MFLRTRKWKNYICRAQKTRNKLTNRDLEFYTRKRNFVWKLKPDGVQEALRTKDKKGANLLHCSVESGNDRLVERVINLTQEENRKSFVNIRRENGFTALHIAAEFGYYNIGKGA